MYIWNKYIMVKKYITLFLVTLFTLPHTPILQTGMKFIFSYKVGWRGEDFLFLRILPQREIPVVCHRNRSDVLIDPVHLEDVFPAAIFLA